MKLVRIPSLSAVAESAGVFIQNSGGFSGSIPSAGPMRTSSVAITVD